MDPVAVRAGVLEALEGDEGGSFGGDQAVRTGMEGAASAGRTHGVECGEPHVDEEVVGGVDAACEGEVRLVVCELLAGDSDCVERAGAGGVEAQHMGAEIQRLLE